MAASYDQILRDTDLVMVNRGGVNYKVTGAQVHAVGTNVFQDADLFNPAEGLDWDVSSCTVFYQMVSLPIVSL